MARNVNTSLDLLRSSLGNISTALIGKGVSGANKLSEVAEQIREIEIKNMGQLNIFITMNNSYSSKATMSLQIKKYETNQQTDVYINSSEIIVTPSSTKTLNKTLDLEVGTYGVRFGYLITATGRKYLIDEYPVYVTKNNTTTINKGTVTLSTAPWYDLGNPEEPWFEGMNISDPEQPLIEKTEEII